MIQNSGGGATEVAEWVYTNISGSFVDEEETLTAPQLALITDPSDLRIEFEASVDAGNGLLNGLVAYWSMQEDSGNTRVDAHGSNDLLEGASVARVSDGRIDLEGLGIRGPSSTWTYLVNDDPFRNQIGMMLTGPGRATIAIYAAGALMPLLLLWGLMDRLLRRRPKRRGDPFRR